MTQDVEVGVVHKTITVGAAPETAFEVFTAKLATWWPKEYSIGESDMADFVLEPKVGGRWYEVGVDGKECDTGRVLAFEPPERVVIAWHLNEAWQFDPDPSHASEFEVRFIAEDSSRTRVELEHRGIERHGDGAPAVHGTVDGPGGWGFVLEHFAKAVTA
ncbi:MAG: SRPBCC family protein [Acidimicrobiales bacterium]